MSKKTIAELAGRKFSMTEQAHDQLQKYLARTKQNLDDDVDAEEVMSDIEDRIAEHLNNIAGKSSVDEKMVDDVISVMGDVDSKTEPKKSRDTDKIIRYVLIALLGIGAAGMLTLFLMLLVPFLGFRIAADNMLGNFDDTTDNVFENLSEFEDKLYQRRMEESAKMQEEYEQDIIETENESTEEDSEEVDPAPLTNEESVVEPSIVLPNYDGSIWEDFDEDWEENWEEMEERFEKAQEEYEDFMDN